MESADVVVVGGGVIGSSVAFHLAARRAGRVVLLEKEAAVGRGSTTKSAGGVRHQFSSEVNVRFSQESIRFFESFDAVMDRPLRFRRWGYLLFTAREERARAMRRAFEMQRRLGVPVEWLERDDLARRAPYLATADLVAGTICPRDGILDPDALVEGLAEGARRLGVELRLGCEVTGVRLDRSRVEAVETARGTIATRCVVDAAGAAAARVARLAGADVPVRPVRRMLVRTGPIDSVPREIPMVIDVDTTFHFKRDGEALVVGWDDPDEKPSESTEFDPAFIERMRRVGEKRAPFLASLRLAASDGWAGLYPETPDRHPLIGPLPGVEGLLLAAGFGGHGVMHAPAAGKVLAEIIVDGRAQTIDVRPLRPERFAEGDAIAETMIF